MVEQVAQMVVHGEAWTIKDLFVLPNEYVYWSIQIVMYPYMTGLVAGAFVLSSLYHVFGVEKLKEIARYALVFSFALLPVAMMPLMLHLQQPLRGIHVMMTPHFTSAISAFGIVFMTYACIVGAEIWFVYRKFFVESLLRLEAKTDRSGFESLLLLIYRVIALGARDLSHEALEADHKAVKLLAGIGIPVACFLHGYAGFIFGSVKANALWMTPLMPVIFICSAVVSGIALCIISYSIFMEMRKWAARRGKSFLLPDAVAHGEHAVDARPPAQRAEPRGHHDRQVPADLHDPGDHPGTARHHLPRLYRGEIVGHPARCHLRARLRQNFHHAVRDRQPAALRHPAVAGADRAARGRGLASWSCSACS